MDTKTSTSRHKNGFNKPIATQKGDGGNFFVPSKIVAMILSCMGNTRSIYLLKTGHSATKKCSIYQFFLKFKLHDCKNSKCHKNWFNNNFRIIDKNQSKCFYFSTEFYDAIRLLLFYFFVNFTGLYDTYFTIERINFTTYIFVGGKTFEITLLTPRNQKKEMCRNRIASCYFKGRGGFSDTKSYVCISRYYNKMLSREK